MNHRYQSKIRRDFPKTFNSKWVKNLVGIYPVMVKLKINENKIRIVQWIWFIATSKLAFLLICLSIEEEESSKLYPFRNEKQQKTPWKYVEFEIESKSSLFRISVDFPLKRANWTKNVEFVFPWDLLACWSWFME